MMCWVEGEGVGVVEEAGRGKVPEWAVVRRKRYRHMARVAALMDEWSAVLELSEQDRLRWCAAAWLHDALRDAEPEALRSEVEEEFRDLPPFFLHGPAVAARLEAEGVTDQELLEAIRYHTMGKAGVGRLGRALMIADFLEPGRPQLRVWRASLRARMPASLEQVFLAVVGTRLRVTIEQGEPVRPEFIAMWNALVESNVSPA